MIVAASGFGSPWGSRPELGTRQSPAASPLRMALRCCHLSLASFRVLSDEPVRVRLWSGGSGDTVRKFEVTFNLSPSPASASTLADPGSSVVLRSTFVPLCGASPAGVGCAGAVAHLALLFCTCWQSHPDLPARPGARDQSSPKESPGPWRSFQEFLVNCCPSPPRQAFPSELSRRGGSCDLAAIASGPGP